MGTSSIYNGPTKSSALLPDDYNPEEKKLIVVSWGDVKTTLSKYINNRPSSDTERRKAVKNLASKYVGASGGSRAIISVANGGISAGRSLYRFYEGIKSEGIKNTLTDLNVDFSGKNIKDVFSMLVNVLSPNSVTKEDIVAREATQSALSSVYDYIERNSMDIDCLDEMPQDVIDLSMKEYFKAYLWGLMLRDLESRLEIYEDNPETAYRIEQDIKDYLASIVDVEFNNDKNAFKADPEGSVKRIMEKCLSVMEGN